MTFWKTLQIIKKHLQAPNRISGDIIIKLIVVLQLLFSIFFLCPQVFDLETFKYQYTVDATNVADGNWMRYVCCARYFEEQNIVSTQNGDEVFYKALKVQKSHGYCILFYFICAGNIFRKFPVFYLFTRICICWVPVEILVLVSECIIILVVEFKSIARKKLAKIWFYNTLRLKKTSQIEI